MDQRNEKRGRERKIDRFIKGKREKRGRRVVITKTEMKEDEVKRHKETKMDRVCTPHGA